MIVKVQKELMRYVNLALLDNKSNACDMHTWNTIRNIEMKQELNLHEQVNKMV